MRSLAEPVLGQQPDVVGFGTRLVEVVNRGELPKELTVTATDDDDSVTEFRVIVRIDTPMEAEYYRHGGILQYVLRQMAG